MKTQTLVIVALAAVLLIGIVAYLVGKSRKARTQPLAETPLADPQIPSTNVKDGISKEGMFVNKQ